MTHVFQGQHVYGRLGLLASLLPDGAAEATYPPHIQNGGHVCGAGAEYRADPDMRNVDAWSLADAIVLICGPMTKRPLDLDNRTIYTHTTARPAFGYKQKDRWVMWAR